MNIQRRRFLSISAAVSIGAAIPFLRQVETNWNGHAFGAEASIKIKGDEKKAKMVLNTVVEKIRLAEQEFSLYDMDSSLSKLNKNNKLLHATNEFINLMHEINRLNQVTNGLFDPTVQPYFEAYSKSKEQFDEIDLNEIKASIGWHNVVIADNNNVFFKKQNTSMTLNGIAQGYATDLVADTLHSFGLENILVNVGEYRSGHSKNRIGIADQFGTLISQITLQNNAIATSSPLAYQFKNGGGHILSPFKGQVEATWKTVSVVAKTATVADGISTALALTTNTELARKLIADQLVQHVVLEDNSGKVIKL